MTNKVKAGFILSIVSHVLAWCPTIYWILAYISVKQLSEGGSSNIGTLNYSFLSSMGTFAIATGVASLVLIGGSSTDPKVNTTKILGRVFAISGFVLTLGVGLFVIFAFLYAVVFGFGL